MRESITKILVAIKVGAPTVFALFDDHPGNVQDMTQEDIVVMLHQGGLVLRYGVSKNPLFQVPVQVPGIDEVHLSSTEKTRKILLNIDYFPAWSVAGLKLDEHVHVAVRSEVITKNGPEQRQSLNVMLPAMRRNAF